MSKKMKTMVQELRRENRLLRETCSVLGDKRLLKKIELSLSQIKKGKRIPLSKL